MLNMLTGETVMQIYSNDNLVGEFKMPSMFKYLGYYNGYFYGISLLPRQEMISSIIWDISLNWL